MNQEHAAHGTLVEFFPQNNLPESRKEKIDLIRILSRSSTLPRVQNINLHPLTSDPEGFHILPGKALSIGTAILANPVEALCYIRYGLEWQIWYNSQNKKELDPRICDIAACQVTARFYETLSHDDRKALIGVPKDFFRIFNKFRGKTLPNLSAEDFQVLSTMHKLPYPQGEIATKPLEAVSHLAYPLGYLLTSGGDLRLKIDQRYLLNKYGCTPFPRPKAFTFASSTATSISNIAFSQTERKRQELIKKCLDKGFKQSVVNFSKEIRNAIGKALQIPKTSSIILAPSGTDIALIFAGLCQTLFQKPITHILVAGDETGSGVPAALNGHHFSDRTSKGNHVIKGEPIAGFKPAEVYSITLRDEKGQLKTTAEIDREVIEAFETALEARRQPVLHVMNQSKLGYVAPTKECLNHLHKKYKDHFHALVDNSQLRLDRTEIQEFVKAGYAMTVTGSKFFTGPPFCGALIVPKHLENILRKSPIKLPDGLEDYCFENDYPNTWTSTGNLKKGSNLGTLMRWYASNVEINRYFDTPTALRNLGEEMFCTHVAGSIREATFLQGLFEGEKDSGTLPLGTNPRTIFPFYLLKDGRVLTHAEAKKVYKLLNQKLSLIFPNHHGNIKLLGDQMCHIGQPVKITYKEGIPSAVVRISLGARVISESWKEQDVSLFFQKIEEQINQVDIIIRKIKLILDHPEWLLSEE